MRTLALGLSIAAIVLALAALARAQPPDEVTGEVVMAGDRALTVATSWSSSRAGRRATVVATIGGHSRTLHDGATVRTAAAARDDALLVVAFHGGDRPFARALVSAVSGTTLGEPVTVELDRSAAQARSATLRPAAAVAARTRDGFVLILQEQEADPTADVVTTLTRLDARGSVVEPTHVVSIPWQLGALAARDEGGYELLVIYGSGSTPDAPRAYACVVSLGPNGEPTEHPWWASADDAYAEVGIAIVAGQIVVAWRGADATSIRATRWTADGGWGASPTAIETLGSVGASEPFALAVRAGQVTLVTP